MPEEEAVASANALLAAGGHSPGREMTRTAVRPCGVTRAGASADDGEMLLSVPVAGGAAALKRLSPEELHVSLHGSWPRIHRGAINACYGRTPWFPHFQPLFAPLLSDSGIREGMSFGSFSLPLHKATAEALDIDGTFRALRESSGDETAMNRIRDLARREAREIYPREALLGLLMRRGRNALLGLLAGVLGVVAFIAGGSVAALAAEPEAPRLETKVYTGYYYFVDEYGDTVRMTLIRDLYVYPPLKFKNKKQEEFYWRTVRDVRKTLPYAKLAFATLCETYEYIQTIPDKKQREAHLKRLEHDIFEQYKPVMKNMTKSQGKVLLKLINRETDQSSYNIVKAFLGSFRAGFWQTFGRFFGMNMKAGFDPDKNKDDATIDRIATLIEQGTL